MQVYIDKNYYEEYCKKNLLDNSIKPSDKLYPSEVLLPNGEQMIGINNAIIKASKEIQRYTSNRAAEDIEEVKYCCCRLVDKINEYDNLKIMQKKQNNKKSETVGKMSVTYSDNKSSNELNKELDIEIREIINLYLSDVTDKYGVNLLYRGN